MAVAWRVLSEYTGVALGSLMVIKQFGWGGADKLLKEEKKKLEDGREKK